MTFKKITTFTSFASRGDNKDLRSFLSINLISEKHLISASLKLQLFRDADVLNDTLRVEVVRDPGSGNWYITPSFNENGFRLFGHKGKDGKEVSFRIWNFQATASMIMDSFRIKDVSQKFIVDESSAQYNDKRMYRILVDW